MDASTGRLIAPDLADFVRSHKVSWETMVHREATPRGLRVIGYDVVLMATCTQPEGKDPGGTGAHAVYEALRAIAERAIPSPCSETVTLSRFDTSFHLHGTTPWEREVEITIEIRHHGDYFAQLDAAEGRCLRHIEDALRAQGVRKGP